MADFERAWSASSRWSLLVMPGETHSAQRRTTRQRHPRFPRPAGPTCCRPPAAAAQRQFDRAEQLIDAARARVSVGCRAAARAGRPALAAVADGRCRAAGARGRCARLFGPSRVESSWHGGVPPTQPGRGVERLEPCRRTRDGSGAGRRPGANSASCRDGSDGPGARSTADAVGSRARATQTVGTACRRAPRASMSRRSAAGWSRFTPPSLERPLMPTTPLALGRWGFARWHA